MKFAAAMAYDQLMTMARQNKASAEDMALLEEKARILGRDVQADLKDPDYEEVDLED